MHTDSPAPMLDMLADAATNPLQLAGRKVDGRTAIAKRYRDLCVDLASDRGDGLSAAQAQVIRRAAALILMAEGYERRMLDGEDIDTDRFVKIVGALNRTLAALGITRTPKDIGGGKTFDAHAQAVWALSGEGADHAG